MYLMLGILSGALFSDAISVYIFRDVDRDKMGRLNEAFAGLCTEAILFMLIIGVPVAVLTVLGGYLLSLNGYSPRAKLCLFLGIGVAVFQYPWDFAGRLMFPQFADSSLGVYLVIAIVFCTVVLLYGSFRQMKSHTDFETPLR